MKRTAIIKNIEIEFIEHPDNTFEGSISLLAYEDSECRYPSSKTYGFAARGAETFMSMATDFFSIFPVKNSAFIIGRRIEIEMDDMSKTHVISIKSLDTNRIFNCLKYYDNAAFV